MAGKRVLIAEDNEKSMRLFRDVLQVNGYETLEATTGEQAVEIATRQLPALVLMDIRLDGIDGLAALRMLRKHQRTASTPIVALTAQAMAGDRERFLDAGFDDYLAKPVNILEFIATVRRHCGGTETASLGARSANSPAG